MHIRNDKDHAFIHTFGDQLLLSFRLANPLAFLYSVEDVAGAKTAAVGEFGALFQLLVVGESGDVGLLTQRPGSGPQSAVLICWKLADLFSQLSALVGISDAGSAMKLYRMRSSATSVSSSTISLTLNIPAQW